MTPATGGASAHRVDSADEHDISDRIKMFWRTAASRSSQIATCLRCWRAAAAAALRRRRVTWNISIFNNERNLVASLNVWRRCAW